jgi:hypothetical protein
MNGHKELIRYSRRLKRNLDSVRIQLTDWSDSMRACILVVATAAVCLFLQPARFASSEEPRMPFAPCGNYDISHLSDYFRVEVSVQPALDDRVEITLVTAPTAEDESRKPFPIDDLMLEFRDAEGKTLLETPVAWTEARDRPPGPHGKLATFTLSRKAARRVILHRIGLHFTPPHHSVVVGFRSLAKSEPAATPGAPGK